MPTLKSKLAFFESTPELTKKFSEYEPLVIQKQLLQQTELDVDVLVLCSEDLQNRSLIETLNKKKTKSEITKLVLAFDENKKLALDIELYNLAKPDLLVSHQNLSKTILHDLWLDISQAEQDESYLNLSSELNSQYEVLKEELEKQVVC